ncbi:hypothetical protein AALH12_07010 [Streptococcus ferus]|uniref:hypothetical protein n=1 Tax=Streptococcus ferus TaxID=1345 RepID=UPI003513E766
MENQSKKLQYTLDFKRRVNFICPKCQYENCSSDYREALIYTDVLDGICALCKTQYTLVKTGVEE